MIAALSACSLAPLTTPVQQHFDRQANDTSYGERCNNEQTKEDEDLCQQWRMAVAAENMLAVSVSQTAILVAALIFSIWAAIAASRQARASEEQLASLDGAHLLVEFSDVAIRELPTGVDFTGPTKWTLRNYGNSVAFIRWRHAQFVFLPVSETPEPLDWQGHVGGAMPHGVIAAPNEESTEFVTDAAEGLPRGQARTLKAGEVCYFQGFAAYTDNGPNLHVYVFTYIYEDGLFRIFHTGRLDENEKYNTYYRRYRAKRWNLWRRSIARRLRQAAKLIEPKIRK